MPSHIPQTVTQGLRATWLLLIPSAVGLLVLGRPAVAFLLERGEFGPESTALVYILMAIFSLRLLGEASYDVLTLTFFAQHNTQTPSSNAVRYVCRALGAARKDR